MDEDVGHTLMHFLYTGDYQTLKPPSVCDMPKRTKEYTRSVIAYHTALSYGLKPLEDHAKRYMEIFDQHVPIFYIIRLARKEFPNIIDNQWYSDYLTARILAAFDEDDGLFLSEEYFEGFGEAPEFDKFLGKVMALAYSKKISTMRSGSASNITVAANPLPPKGVQDTVHNGKSPAGDHGYIKYAEQRFSFHAPEPECNHGQGVGARIKGTDLRIDPEPEGYCHPVFETSGQTRVTEDAGLEYPQSSPISIVTPDSDFDGDYIPEHAPSSSETRLSGYRCPNWQTHLLNERLYKNCKACRTCIRQMFVDL